MSRRNLIAASLALMALPLLAAAPVSAGTPSVPPGIRLWTSHSDTYHRGERVRIYFRTERDAFVTIFRVDTDGRLRVLFPRDPNDPNLAHGGETYTVAGVDNDDAFYVDDYPGVGYVFGVASQDPFDYDAMMANAHWDFDAVANLADGRLHGDPYATLQQVVQGIEPEGYADYDTHLLPYYVEQRYDYPRFLCYDCHSYVPYSAWDPYAHFCSQYSLFVYYDPFYFYPSYWYPTRYYGGTAVVYVRPRFAGSQYVFRSPDGQAGVVYRDRRNSGTPGTPQDRGVRGTDIGGVGTVPSPGSGRRWVPGAGGAAGALASPGGVPVQRQAIPGNGAAGGNTTGNASGRDDRGRRGNNDHTYGGDQGQGKDRGFGNDPGRRRNGVTDLGVIGPSAPQFPASKPPTGVPQGERRYIGGGSQPAAAGGGQGSPDAPRGRGVYIDPGNRPAPRSADAPPQPAAGRYIQPGEGNAPRGEAQGGGGYTQRREAPPAPRAGPPAPRAEAPRPQAQPQPRPQAQPQSRPQAQPQSRPSGRSDGTPTLIRRRP